MPKRGWGVGKGCLFHTASNIQVTQAWFESGGVVSQAFLLIVTNFVFVEGLKVFQIYPLVMRFLVSPFVISQTRKNALWAPPRMLLGDLYAGAVKTVALCLICKLTATFELVGHRSCRLADPVVASCSVRCPSLPPRVPVDQHRLRHDLLVHQVRGSVLVR